MTYLAKLKALSKKRIPLYIRLLAFVAVLYFAGFLNPLLRGDLSFTLKMPGQTYAGNLLPLTKEEGEIKQLLHEHIEQLTLNIGERNLHHYENLKRSEAYIAESFRALGYDVKYQQYNVSGKLVSNIEAMLPGNKKPEEILVIGAHYDSVHTVAANDNGTGVAALLELARILKTSKFERTIRFVAFVNEEPPYFQTKNMGSLVYAKRSYERGEKIIGAFSLETMGYYSNKPGSQHYPFPLSRFYPDTGNFIGFVGNAKSKIMVQNTVRIFRENAQFPSEGAAITEYISGVGWSDHWSFWQFVYPGLMITDTAPYRYPYYHTEEDTIDKINFEYMARVVSGLAKTFEVIANQ